MSDSSGSDGIRVFTGEGITYYKLCALKARLRLEMKGLRMGRRHGPTAYSQARKLGLRGNRDSVLAQLEMYIECWQHDGLEVYETDWPTAHRLEQAGFVTIGPARGPGNKFKRITRQEDR